MNSLENKEQKLPIFLKDACQKSGFYHCDSTKRLYYYAADRKKPFREIFRLKRDDRPPSEAAHRLVAEALKEFIVSKGFAHCGETTRETTR